MRSASRHLATAALTVGVGAAALAGTISATPDASATVNSGRYTLTSTTFGVIPSAPVPVVIKGDRITIYNPTLVQRGRIHSTRSGGYFDVDGGRVTLHRRAHGVYTGLKYAGSIVIGDVRLAPRR